MNFKYPLILLLLLALPSLSYALGCGLVPSSLSSLTIACYPVNITNSQNAATPTGFQQMLTMPTGVNAIAGNVFFYNGISGSVLPAWGENSAIMWTTLEANVIPAYTGANGIYYFGIGAPSTSFVVPSTANDVGIAPQFTTSACSSYGACDNGASVFNYYQNFAGTNLPSGWSSNYACGGFCGTAVNTINNGLTIAPSVTNINSGFWIASNIVTSASTIDFYGNFGGDGYRTFGLGIAGEYAPLYLNDPEMGVAFMNRHSSTIAYFTAWAAGAIPTSWSVTTNGLYTIERLSSSTVGMVNYVTPATESNQYDSNSYNFGFGQGYGNPAPSNTFVQYTRVRDSPPAGVMPTTSFGAVDGGFYPVVFSNVTSSGVLTTNSYVANQITSSYYPYKISTSSSDGVTTFNLNQTYAGTLTNLQTGVSNLNYVPPSNQPPVGMFISCINNVAGGSCWGSVIYTKNVILTSNLTVTNSITINSGNWLFSNGFSLFAGMNVVNNGVISTGKQSGIWIGTPGGTATVWNALPANDLSASWGASGGGGGGYATGSIGANLITMPTGTTANMLLLASNLTQYASGASGGGGSGISATYVGYGGKGGNTLLTGGAGGAGNSHSQAAGTGGNGGNGALGILIEANQITAGTINANGTKGGSGVTDGSGGGGGAGGLIFLAYNSVYNVGTYNYSGGLAGSQVGGGGGNGGAGGNGNVLVYQWKTSQPIPTKPYPYLYQIKETNGGGSVFIAINLTAGMTDITNSLTYNSPLIQYFPNGAYLSSCSFPSLPTSWNIHSDIVGNNHVNSTAIPNLDQFSNANQTIIMNGNLLLNYPFTSFSPNILNNPKLQASIVQFPFNIYESNVLPANVPSIPNNAMWNRRIFNITTKNEQTLIPMNTSTTFSFSALFNNYTINNQTKYSGYNSVGVWMANSLYSNPNIYFSTIIGSSINSSYYPAQNNWCARTETSSQAANLFPYLVTYASGQSTTVNLQSNWAGANNNDYFQLLEGVNPTYALVVQQMLISSQSFTIPLVIGNSYSAIILGTGCTQIYSTSSSTQANPWYINIVSNAISVPTTQLPNVTATCSLAYNSLLTANVVTCKGTDTASLTNAWGVTLYNMTGFAGTGTHTIATNTVAGGSFVWSYYPIAYAGPVMWKINWFWGGINDPAGSASGTLQNIIATFYSTPLDTLLTVIFLLVGIAAGSQTSREHKLSMTCFIEAFIIAILYMVGITSWLMWVNWGLVGFLIIIGLFGYGKESGSGSIIGG